MPTDPPFEPCAVVDVDITPGHPVEDVTGLDAYTRALVLVRLDAVPIGYVTAPVESGRISGHDLGRRILDAHEDRLVRRLLAKQLDVDRPDQPEPRHVPSLTVIVCTRNRVADLSICLASLDGLSYPDLEVLVVDNAPSDLETERLVTSHSGRARYVREPRPGLSWARCRGIAEARGEIIAFIDDDVRVDASWAHAIARPFDDADVTAVLGLVAPAELETRAQEEFEWHGGFGHEFNRRWLRRPMNGPMPADLCNTGTFGKGANMAFRRSVFAEVGVFDTDLGAGTKTQGGEDVDMIFRVLEAGHTVVFEPAALVWHRHRRTQSELHQQCIGWGRGMGAYLTRTWIFYPAERRGVLTLALGLLLVYHPRRIVQAVFDRRLRVWLALAEWYGTLTGGWRYLEASRAQSREPANTRPPTPRPSRGSAMSVHAVELDLDSDWTRVLPSTAESDAVECTVIRKRQVLGRIVMIAGRRPVSRCQMIEAIVTRLSPELLDPDDSFRTAFRQSLAGRNR